VTGLFCKLKWEKHKKDPTSVPKFKDLVLNSPDCDNPMRVSFGSAVKAAREYDTRIEKDGDEVPYSIPPTGFVFHEGRCGSTLVANALAAVNPGKNRVYSESAPFIAALRACEKFTGNCDHSKHIALLRDVVYMMGRTSDIAESRLFFKVQSIGTNFIHIVREAFPITPWVFVYRDPVQVMMSHLKKKAAIERGRAICLKTLRRPSPDIIQFVEGKGESIDDISNQEFCAVHLAVLCNKAMDNFDVSKTGIMLSYDDISNTLMNSVLPNHFNVPVGDDERKRIVNVCGTYSKARETSKRVWVSDSERKEDMASAEIKEASDKFLAPSYARMQLATSVSLYL